MTMKKKDFEIQKFDPTQTDSFGEIVLYQPNNDIRLEVRIAEESVWLSQAQMALLFQSTPQNITLHIRNIYKEEELEPVSTCKDYLQVQKEGTRIVRRKQKMYNLDVIISVGYRVKSIHGTRFRKWANRILKEYLLRGYSVNNRLERLEQRVSRTEEKIDFFVRTSLPPQQGIFFDGQVFDAYKFVCNLVRKAQKTIVLIDNYVDDTVLTLLDKRSDGVSATIYTKQTDDKLMLDLKRHNEQYDSVQVIKFNKAHDRFLLIDDEVYQIGASIKDLGKKWFAFTLLRDISALELLKRITCD